MLETSKSILGRGMYRGSRDQLAERPEGQEKGHGKGKEKEASVFHGLEEVGSLSCSQTTRQAAATTRSWTGLAREQAPWLQEQDAGEAPEGHIHAGL